MRHEMGWDNNKVHCSCGWISEPSTSTSDTQNRKDQQTQFIQHQWEMKQSIQLGESDDSNQ